MVIMLTELRDSRFKGYNHKGDRDMKVIPLKSNQTEVQVGNTRILVSYQTPVAVTSDEGTFKTEKKWSCTTTRHINQWLDGRTATEISQEWFDHLLEGKDNP